MELKNNYKLFLEAIVGLMVIDAKGKLIYINEQCADYIKVDRNNSIGKNVVDVFPESTMVDMLNGDNVYNRIFYFSDGRISVSNQVQLRSDSGEVIGVLEYDMIQDIDGLDDFFLKYSAALKDEMEYFRNQVRNFQNTKYSIANIKGSSKKISELKYQIELAATTNSTVLISGETGTGKELVAHSIHNLSSRACNDFIKVNAAGLPENLIESELFGYEEGAFTGAKKEGKKGKFLLANKGTLFIDEINQMPLMVQPKLLRALQEGEISPIGSETDVSVDVRIIAATNQNLYELIEKGVFREDLYYRLNVFPITVPPLRERIEDIPELVESKVMELNNQLGKRISYIEPGVYKKLREYNWPGNIRELYNRVESAMNYAQDEKLKVEHFNFDSVNSIDFEMLKKYDNPIEAIKREAEKRLIDEVLKRFNNNKTQAANYLNISRPLLYQKMKRLGIKV